MIRATRLLGLLLIVALTALPVLADKAKSLYDKARDAEARQNYEQAYELYKQAYDLRPKDIRYRTSYERTKFLAAASHVHRGQLLREAGKLEEALAEFQKAYAIDPSSFIAQQEIKSTQDLINQAKNPPPQAHVQQDVLKRMAERARGPVELKPISEQPITLHMTEDTKTVYTTLGKLAGINVLFDPDYVSKRITVDLNNVTLFQALEIVALQSKTFWRPVTSTTIFVAADTKPKRTELEQSVVKTFYLQNLSQATEVQDVTNTLRQILEIQKVQPLTSEGAIIVRGTPDQIALAEKIVSDLDKARPEVIVEVAVMQVRRDKIRELGINPPQTASVALQPNVTTTTTGTGTTTTTPTGTTTTPQINLNSLANLSASDFSVTFPQASVSFLFSDANTKIIQNPQIRALDGQKASLKIGDRIPIATGSFQPGIGGIGINPLVNTQFQYQDVGVNIDMTPQIHADREVTLKITLEISSVTGQTNIGGIQQPIIGQRKIDHTIRLKEGEINLMGGILEQQDIKNLSGFPWISQVPILKYLFSQEHIERHDNEIVFALIPRIVRGPEITELNTRAVDVGTANAIELRYNNNGGLGRTASPVQPPQQGPPPQQTPQQPPAMQPATPVPQTVPPTQPPAQPGTPVPPQPGQAQPPPVQPGQTTPTPPTAGGAILSFDPPQVAPAMGSTFAVNIALNGAANVYSVPLQVSFNPNTLQLVNISNGGFLSRDGQVVTLVHREGTPGSVQMTATRPPGSGGVSGQGTVFTLTFMAKAHGQSVISIDQAGARDGNMQPIPLGGAQAMVTVR